MKYAFIMALSSVLYVVPLFASADGVDQLIQSANHTANLAAAVAQANIATSTLSSLHTSTGNQDLVGFTRPAVVRLLTHITGTTTIPQPAIDFTDMSVSAAPNGEPLDVPADDYITGTGFIIRPDGFILTAAHVVTDKEDQISIASDIAQNYIVYRMGKLTPKERAIVDSYADPKEEGAQLAINLINFFRKNMTSFTVSTVVVEPATSTEASSGSALVSSIQNSTDQATTDQAGQLFTDGEKATVVAANDSYLDDEKDVAVLKIPENNLPALHLGDSASVQSGQPIYVFGFPDTADTTGLTTDPSFTAGSVSALKDSTLKTFKYLQIDAKISPGSSGGPLFDADGNAIGIIVQATGSDSIGDNFAFALPINIAKEFLAAHGISADYENDYVSLFLAGLQLEQQKHCKAALGDFNAAAGVHSPFVDVSAYLKPHISNCTALIASGQSIDSILDQGRVWFAQHAAPALGGIVFILLLGGGWYVLRKRRAPLQSNPAVQPYMPAVNTTAARTIVPAQPVQPIQSPAVASVLPATLSR